ncbi:MAG: hypothetical protein EBR88_00025 [Betaproteobacteria bacterium]|nr:hypothetical protein [Betaproteobacteria bacterium]
MSLPSDDLIHWFAQRGLGVDAAIEALTPRGPDAVPAEVRDLVVNPPLGLTFTRLALELLILRQNLDAMREERQQLWRDKGRLRLLVDALWNQAVMRGEPIPDSVKNLLPQPEGQP